MSDPGEFWRLGSAELRCAIEDAEFDLRLAQGRYLRILAEAEARGVGMTFGYSSLGALVSGISTRSRGQANKMARQAQFVREFPVAGQAVVDGSISVEHLDVIAEFRKSLSGAVHPEVWDESEPVLVELSRSVDPSGVKRFANGQLRPRIDPDGALPAERELAEPRNSLSMRTRTNGWVELHGLLEPESGALLGSQIGPMTTPTAQPDGTPDPRTLEERQGDAMSQWIGVGHAGMPMPSEGGERPQLVVTIGLDALTEGLGYGAMGPDNLPIPVSEVRRLACDCSIVLSADSAPLDIGRASRNIPPNIRRAVVNRDRGCAFPGCDRPSSWCEVHHIREWRHGGETKTGNLTLLCGSHHRLVHHSEWEVRMTSGFPEFLPPSWPDPDRNPRTNPIHQPTG